MRSFLLTMAWFVGAAVTVLAIPVAMGFVTGLTCRLIYAGWYCAWNIL